MSSSDPNKLIAKADKLTKLTVTRWSADWKGATALYEQAANGFRLSKDYEKSKEAFEKASKGQEILSSPWDAAKHMESAASLAKELRSWNEVADLYRRASELYIECGRSQPASDALAKGGRYSAEKGSDTDELVKKAMDFPGKGSEARKLQSYNALEEAVPDQAVKLYTDACEILEEDGKGQMSFDLYRAAASVYIKLEKYLDAATVLLKLAEAAEASNATHSQCKAYLSAIIVYLYAHNFKEAEKCHNDCCQITAFFSSDQNRAANKLLSAYGEGDVEEIKRVAQSSTISNLDHAIIKLARKLPTGDVSSFKTDGKKEEEEEPLDEDDLT